MKRNHGFTLIELALVIAIIGFISVGMLRVFESLRTQTGRTDTEISLDQAEEALRRF
ncbi:MAG: prepilin-type N-terminal cleavage/methylation domain-containing protein, partial [Gammaproteobacteria bacterium]